MQMSTWPHHTDMLNFKLRVGAERAFLSKLAFHTSSAFMKQLPLLHGSCICRQGFVDRFVLVAGSAMSHAALYL